MKLIPGMRNAMHSLSIQKGRTVLMMLGVIVGVGMLTSIVALGEYTQKQVEDGFRAMMGGTWDVVVVTPEAAATRDHPNADDVERSLTLADAEAIDAEISTVRLVSPFQNTSGEFKYEDRSMTVPVFGATANWLDLWDDGPGMGEHYTEEDDRRMNRVCVIGMGVATTLFGEENPVGKTLKINNVNMQVKGVFKARGAGGGGGDMDNIAYVPFSTLTKRLEKMEHLTMVMAHLTDSSEKDVAMTQIRQLLRERHQIPEGNPDDFQLTSPIDAMNRQLEQVAIPFEQYIRIGSIVALLIGGLVVMNIMTISVSERAREIGLRRSLGAKRRDIVAQFLLEATAVTLLGGLIGAGVTIGGSYALSQFTEAPLLLSPSATGLALISSILVGLFFGIQPARKAANLDPIEALRK